MSSPPVHAVGVEALTSHTAQPKEVTCILCQEETKDFAPQRKVLVQAVRVQQSCVLKRGEDSNGKEIGGIGCCSLFFVGVLRV